MSFQALYQLGPLGFVQDLHGAQPGRRVGGDRGQHPGEPARDGLRGRLIEQVRRGGQPTAQPARLGLPLPVAGLAQAHAQVEPGRPGPGRDGRTPARPGRPAAAGALFCTVSMTWNSGWRASDRSGARSSTSRSNGTS